MLRRGGAHLLVCVLNRVRIYVIHVRPKLSFRFYMPKTVKANTFIWFIYLQTWLLNSMPSFPTKQVRGRNTK